MKQSKKMLGITAFAVLTAWTNVQAMACCWTFEAPAEKVQAEVSGEHACCPGQEDAAAGTSSSDKPQDCGMDMSGVTKLCCELPSPAEAATSAVQPSFHPVALAFHTLEVPVNKIASPSHSPPSALEIASGPPRYLALERILI